ncbi:MAG: hypothetical protein CL874_04555 [Dehalococcoidales bacterium]|jgi:hypothetical protein|nr:hypothetical protein [Dehalococcoidales bacterium]
MEQQEPKAKSRGYKWGVTALVILAVVTVAVVACVAPAPAPVPVPIPVLEVTAEEEPEEEAVPVLSFTKTFGGEGDDVVYSVQQTADGGYVIAGYTVSYDLPAKEAYLVKTDGKGNEEWQRTFGGEEYDVANSVQQTADGGYVIAGYTESLGEKGDVYLIKTDGKGNEEWHRTFGGEEYDVAFSVRQTADGGYVIAGRTGSYGAGRSDAYVIKTDGEGSKEWHRAFGGGDDDIAFSVRQTADGGYVLAGSIDPHAGHGYDVYLMKIDEEGN